MAARQGRENCNTISDVVSTVYCEQKAVFDREYGKNESSDVRAKREDGIIQHKRFEKQGRKAQDRRCFIATAVYGPDAVETNFLRAWRDRVLMPSIPGRLLVRLYYRTSPLLLPAMERHVGLAGVVRSILDRFVRFLGAK